MANEAQQAGAALAAAQLARVRKVLTVLDTETGSRQYALEDIARIVGEPDDTPGTADGQLTDYEQEYAGFWRRLVENPDGTLNADQVKRELHDYSMLIRQVPEAYDGVTNGRISKPNTMPGPVIDAVEERISDAEDDAINDLITNLEAYPDQAFTSIAEVVAVIRGITGVTGGN
jgi:hypothetical protein